jgi:hypothetical protein
MRLLISTGGDVDKNNRAGYQPLGNLEVLKEYRCVGSCPHRTSLRCRKALLVPAICVAAAILCLVASPWNNPKILTGVTLCRLFLNLLIIMVLRGHRTATCPRLLLHGLLLSLWCLQELFATADTVLVQAYSNA